jgi:hypothetical protein
MAVLQHPLTMVSFVGANDRDILPHFLRHYRALGARSFELTIQGDWDDANRSRLESESDVQLSAHRDVPFTEELRLRDLNRMAAHHRNSWILHADVDEFLQLPAATLEETIDWLTRLRSEALPAVLVQRLSATGELPSVDDGAELDELFPSWNFGLTEDMGVRPPVWKNEVSTGVRRRPLRVQTGQSLPTQSEHCVRSTDSWSRSPLQMARGADRFHRFGTHG